MASTVRHTLRVRCGVWQLVGPPDVADDRHPVPAVLLHGLRRLKHEWDCFCGIPYAVLCVSDDLPNA